jgi:quercetin dioxygenase-like cupin family protein
MRFFIGDESHDLGPGGLVVIPPNVTHWGEVLGEEPVINLDVFTPKRPEYAP